MRQLRGFESLYPYVNQRMDHQPVDYRPAGSDRCETPADVCGTCSDFERGHLVPVSFCAEARRKSEEFYGYLAGGPEPGWMWTFGPDAADWTPQLTA